MTRLTVMLIATALLFVVTPAHADAPKMTAPTPPPNALMKPTFLLANESWSGGTAFLVRTADRPETLLVTCHHLFGPATGRRKQMSDEDIRRDVCGAVALSMQDRKTIVIGHSYVGIPNAREFDAAGAERDLAAFVVDGGGKDLPAFAFAEKPPRAGDTVYLYARLRSETQPKLMPAVVARAEANWLLYAFKEKDIDLAGTSGAPVLDERGHVVGMNVGGGEQNGQITGIANPAARMKELVGPPRK